MGPARWWTGRRWTVSTRFSSLSSEERKRLIERLRRPHHRRRLRRVGAIVSAELHRPDPQGQRCHGLSPAALHASPDIGEDVANRIQVSGTHMRRQLRQERLECGVVEMEQGEDVQFVCRGTN